jgi:hypothetical protein
VQKIHHRNSLPSSFLGMPQAYKITACSRSRHRVAPVIGRKVVWGMRPNEGQDCGSVDKGHVALAECQSESLSLEHSGGPPLFCVRCRN